MVLLIMFRLNNERYSYIQILEMYLNSVLDKGTAFSLLNVTFSEIVIPQILSHFALLILFTIICL